MNSRLIMTLSAILMFIAGVVLIFSPHEIAQMLVPDAGGGITIVFQMLGALFFGFGMLNWMARGSIIGGIYSKPVSLANFSHYLIGALALIKALLRDPLLPASLWAGAAVYRVFAVLFWLILSRHPGQPKGSGQGL